MSYKFGARMSGGKMYFGPVGSEVIGESNGVPVFGNDEGVAEGTFVGTVDKDGLKYE